MISKFPVVKKVFLYLFWIFMTLKVVDIAQDSNYSRTQLLVRIRFAKKINLGALPQKASREILDLLHKIPTLRERPRGVSGLSI